MEAVLEARRDEVDDFQRRWFRFVRRWRAATRRDLDEARAMVERVLADGLPDVGDADPPPPPDAVQAGCARAVVAASGFLDSEDYTVQHRLRRGTDPVRHFVEEGWRSLRAPSLRFDLWSYWVEHLDPTDESVNPLLHYLLRGRQLGFRAVPEPAGMRTPTRLEGAPRRACLFAGYDRDGLVDDTVVAYVTELARHADVFYVADGVLEPGELAKLDGVTTAAWCVPHGAYDFGSFSLLARELVGWERLAEYDEVVLANDSCYLLRPLDEVFARMDARACDWWSLQASSMEHDESYAFDDAPVPLAEAKRRFTGTRHWQDDRHLHLSSYFVVYRRPVLDDPGFRWRLDTVTRQREKRLVIHKYEVGISRYLLGAGFDFDTFLPDLWAFHPLYGRHFFEIVHQGFPLVKRNFLGENPRHVPDLAQWEERLRPVVPDAPYAAMRAHLERVTAPGVLREAYGARLAEDGRRHIPLRATQGYGLRRLDRETPSFEHWWAFPVSSSGRLDPGLRAVLEEVREDPSLHKVVLTRGRPLADVEALAGERVTVLPVDTPDGQAAMVRCGLMLTDDAPVLSYPFSFPRSRHRFAHVGTGLPVLPSRPRQDADWSKLHAMAVSSPGEALVRTATIRDLPLERFWPTGLPRHDHLLLAPEDLPRDLQAAERRLRQSLAGRPLVVWWATGDAQALPRRLADWAREHDVVVGVREPHVDRPDGWTRALIDAGLPRVLSLSDRRTASPVPVLRVASAVVTDGGDPLALDALVTGVPLLRVAGPDLDVRLEAALPDEGWSRPTTVADADDLLESLTSLAGAGFPRRAVTTPDRAAPLDGAAARRFVHRLRLNRR